MLLEAHELSDRSKADTATTFLYGFASLLALSWLLNTLLNSCCLLRILLLLSWLLPGCLLFNVLLLSEMLGYPDFLCILSFERLLLIILLHLASHSLFSFLFNGFSLCLLCDLLSLSRACCSLCFL